MPCPANEPVNEEENEGSKGEINDVIEDEATEEEKLHVYEEYA